MKTQNASSAAPAAPSGDTTVAAGRRRLLAAASGAGLVAAAPRFAIGQAAWPNKPVKIFVTNPPGGLTDAYARAYAEALSAKFGQPFLVENKPGAGGTIAADALAKSPADGYSFLVAITTPMWQGRVLYRKLPYSPDAAFAPISLFPSGALVMGVNAKLPVKTPNEYVAWATKNDATMGTYAPASWPHMVADTWNRTRELKIEAIHYKGEPPMWMDVSQGIVSAGVGTYQAMSLFVERGQIRPIGALGQHRSPRLPNLPTFVEQGHTDPVFALDGWLPLVAPAGTPQEIQQKVAEAVVDAYRTPKLRQMHETWGIPNGPVGLDEARRRWKNESPQWIAIADRLGIKLD